MQPYFLPYVGYFQLIESVDLFIVYDNIKYTKKGWINRNRMLRDGHDAVFSLPLKHDSDALDVSDRVLSTEFRPEKLLREFTGAYRRAPYFVQTFPLIERIVRFEERNLFGFLHHALVATCEHLEIGTEIRRSSEIAIDHELKGQEKVLALCGAVGTDVYVNAIGGRELYESDEFRRRGITLRFIKSGPFAYRQFGVEFVPALSIIDVMMFTPRDALRRCITTNYELV
jgi:WbqC-like protein family